MTATDQGPTAELLSVARRFPRWKRQIGRAGRLSADERRERDNYSELRAEAILLEEQNKAALEENVTQCRELREARAVLRETNDDWFFAAEMISEAAGAILGKVEEELEVLYELTIPWLLRLVAQVSNATGKLIHDFERPDRQAGWPNVACTIGDMGAVIERGGSILNVGSGRFILRAVIGGLDDRAQEALRGFFSSGPKPLAERIIELLQSNRIKLVPVTCGKCARCMALEIALAQAGTLDAELSLFARAGRCEEAGK